MRISKTHDLQKRKNWLPKSAAYDFHSSTRLVNTQLNLAKKLILLD